MLADVITTVTTVALPEVGATVTETGLCLTAAVGVLLVALTIFLLAVPVPGITL